jgi:predicted DNA-binding protein
MTESNDPISVRLDNHLRQKLDDYCARTGVTRSCAVQEGLAQYLVTRTGPSLSSLAEEVLPPPAEPDKAPRSPRQQRYRDYVLEKRRR